MESQGADFVEMDVQLTKDLQVVVYHDFETVITPRKVSFAFVFAWMCTFKVCQTSIGRLISLCSRKFLFVETSW